MKRFVVKTDLDEKKILKEWNGKFITDDCYDKVVKHDDDFLVVSDKTDLYGNPEIIACVMKRRYKGRVYRNVRSTLLSINDTSNMRANCAGPIDEKRLFEERGWIKDVHYRLKSPNLYEVKKKDGSWNDIAQGNAIHSLLVGYKRGRFTGKIALAAWCNVNKEKWEVLQQISRINEKAMKQGVPVHWKAQKNFAESFIKPEHRMGIYTAYSPNKYNFHETKQMSAHRDKGDLGSGLTSMVTFRVGNYTGAHLVFPRYRVGVDVDDGDVLIGNSNQIHGVSEIYGEGTRLSCVAYCDWRVATSGPNGRPEKLIGQAKKKAAEYSLGAFV